MHQNILKHLSVLNKFFEFKVKCGGQKGFNIFIKHFLFSSHLGHKFTTRNIPLSRQTTVSTKEKFL